MVARDWPLGAAASTILTLLLALLIAAYRMANRKGRLARPHGRGGVMMRKLGKLWLWIVRCVPVSAHLCGDRVFLQRRQYTSAWKGFTLKWYSQLFGNAALIDAVVNTLSVAALAASLATLLGVLAALCLKRTEFPGRQLRTPPCTS